MSERDLLQVETGASHLLKPPGHQPQQQLSPGLSPPSRRHSTYLQTGGSSRRSSHQAVGSLVQQLPAGTRRRASMLRRGTKERLQIGRGSVFSASEQSSSGIPSLTFENTYQLSPGSEQEFQSGQVQRVMKEVVEEGLKDQVYREDSTPQLACLLTQRLKDALKRLHCSRHKLCCYVVLGEYKNQGVHMASQCLWTPDTDSYATVTVNNASLFAVATAYGLYYE